MHVSYTFLLQVILVGLVLSADSFSAALAMGFRPHKTRDAIQFGLLSGGAEAFCTYLGAIAGESVVSRFAGVDHWIAFILLLAVAIHMAYDGVVKFRNPEAAGHVTRFHGLLMLIMVSFATSIDGLAVGVGLGVSGKPIVPFVISIGIWAFISTILGMAIAKRVSHKLGPLFSLVGAIILAVLAVIMFDSI